MNVCTFLPDGTFQLDGKLISVDRAFDCELKLHPDCTWDSMMLAVAREPEIFDILCKSATWGFKVSELLKEYNELKDQVDAFDDLEYLEFTQYLEIEDDIPGITKPAVISINFGFNGIPRDPSDPDRYSLSMHSPVKLQGLKLRLDHKLHYYSERFPGAFDDMMHGFTVGDIFKAAFEDMTFYGIGLDREEKRLGFEAMILEIDESINLGRDDQFIELGPDGLRGLLNLNRDEDDEPQDIQV